MARHSLRSCRIVGESMAPTLKSRVHENRHGNLHGWRKIKKSFRASNIGLGPSRFPVKRLLAGGRVHDRDHEGLMMRSTACGRTVRRKRPPSFGVTPWPSAVNGRCGIRHAPGNRWSRQRRGRPLWSSLGPWPSIDSRRRCEKSRVGDR